FTISVRTGRAGPRRLRAGRAGPWKRVRNASDFVRLDDRAGRASGKGRTHMAEIEDGDMPAPGESIGDLLIVDDDEPFCRRLAQAMEKRGFTVHTAGSVADGKKAAAELKPDYAIVDLRLGDGSGLDVVSALSEAGGDTRVVMLTGYGNI